MLSQPTNIFRANNLHKQGKIFLNYSGTMIIFLTFAAEIVSFGNKGKRSQHLDISTIKSIIDEKHRANSCF